jgi:SAM-dependent methyltransferase
VKNHPPAASAAAAAAVPTAPQQYGNLEANLRFIEQTGALATPCEVLEIGSGAGTLLHELSSRGHRVQGIEVDPVRVEDVRRWYPDLAVRLVRGTALPFPDAAFDVVLSFDVFEHIPDSDAHLREVRRVLRPGGIYLMQTPNKWTNIVFETIRWRSFTRFREDHCSLHTLGQLRRRLRAHGFIPRVFDVPVVNAFFRQKVARHLGVVGSLALAVCSPDRLPLGLRTNLYVAATRIEAAP